MPQSVRQALIDAFEKEGEMAVEDAKAFLAKMEKDGRYKQETW
jgi:sulfite reductase alpha subunit-like flavoprotein